MIQRSRNITVIIRQEKLHKNKSRGGIPRSILFTTLEEPTFFFLFKTDFLTIYFFKQWFSKYFSYIRFLYFSCIIFLEFTFFVFTLLSFLLHFLFSRFSVFKQLLSMRVLFFLLYYLLYFVSLVV
jgi:hypothetical protein